ncbi:high affinity cAMP-specific and IBMX-insensitive 3',5'-cyclic phosphodiesterase 8B-like isoform X3 [Lineus longissimus]|uniref:high affinity cAMP-specific and IBMX-insensitive 3',5'-cyclic phosphodiesterase 8B-like isoform X3 n=1 Tax=Lineus longissimus TaxID=88925 RepID=UPI00315D22A2
MGCTPSVHGSHSGVSYCRDSDDSNSPRPSIVAANLPGRPVDPPLGERESEARPSRSHGSAGKRSRRSTLTVSIEAETQTSCYILKGTENQIPFGPMKLRQHTMSILLVFGKEDSQSDGFWWAADKAGYQCNIVKTSEASLESYLDKHHDIVIIDHRQSKYFDAEALCRSIRATKASEHTVIVAVTKKHSSDKEEPSILPLINAGFNRRYVENSNVGSCLNELISLEHCEVRARQKMRASEALFTALENIFEGVEITNSDHEIEYVNHSYERMTGYTSEELIGKNLRELPKSDKNSDDMQETIQSQLKKGKRWEGVYYMRRKNGESIQQHSRIIPITGPAGRVHHHVALKSARLDMQLERLKDADLNQIANDPFGLRRDDFKSLRKGSYDVRSLSSDGGVHPLPHRRESMARIHSMTIEAPITKVINIINAAQENSPYTVAQALDKVLEILRSTELYSPIYTQQVKEEDQMTTDLVGGLMSQGIKRRLSNTETFSGSQKHHHHIPSSPTGINCLQQIPEDIQTVLELEQNWAFDIVELERLSQNRPLVYLGLKIFNRFGVGEFLQVNETTLRNWLQVIEANYHSSNPYHNSTHAADVLQATAYFLERDKVKGIFDELDEVASLIAAIIHDVDHPGKTNAFLVNSGSDLAVLYNDLAVLESHHAALAFQLTGKDDRVNIFKNLDRDDYRAIRQTIIDMVLATEMQKHFEHLSKFVNNIVKVYCKDTDDSASVQSGAAGDPLTESPSPNNGLSTPENRGLIRRMLIKCADISNPTRPLEMCQEWARRISEEYFNQTDDERSRGLPIMMPVFDRKTCSIPKSQISFIDYFLTDMFNAWDEFSDCPELMTCLQTNYVYWKQQDELQAKEKEKEHEEEKDEDEATQEQTLTEEDENVTESNEAEA